MKALGFWTVFGIWATLCVIGVSFALWSGYGGRALAATLTTFAFLLLPMLAFAARGVPEYLTSKLGPTSGLFHGLGIFMLYLVYAVGTGSVSILRVLIIAGFVFVPILLGFSAGNAAAGTWQDFFIIASVWVFVKFGPTHYLWPYPGNRLAYVATVLLAVNVALATFVLTRRAKGIGYSIGWGKTWTIYILGSLIGFAVIAIPLGTRMRFIAFAPQWSRWTSMFGVSLAILLFTAWPEELLFRGLLQNFLSKLSKSDFAGGWTASVLFGLTHITNMHFPNWKYVILASIAGIFYGWTWYRTKSIFASALVHAGVDVLWHFLFRTL